MQGAWVGGAGARLKKTAISVGRHILMGREEPRRRASQPTQTRPTSTKKEKKAKAETRTARPCYLQSHVSCLSDRSINSKWQNVSQPEDQQQDPGQWGWSVTKEHVIWGQNVGSLKGDHGEVCLWSLHPAEASESQGSRVRRGHREGPWPRIQAQTRSPD